MGERGNQSGLLGCVYGILIAVVLLLVVGVVGYVGLAALDGLPVGPDGSSLVDVPLLSELLAPADSVPPSSTAPHSGSGADVEPLAPPTPQPTSRTESRLAAAARIRIPAINVDRAVIGLPLTENPGTGIWERDVESLFRTGRNDLVGHWGGSAQPGQAGNMILVGHNYGYGQTGAFLKLGRLKPGEMVHVITRGGDTLSYRVTEVERLWWRRKNQQELVQHNKYLALGGPERLTLVTCGGASRAPFPQNIYVVAEPVQ